MAVKNKQLANLITISRIFGVGFIFWLTPFQTNLWQLWAIVVYTVVCFTDFLDGYIARRLKIVSDFGKIADPLADKILVLVFLPLLQMQAITSFPVFLILSREFIVMGMRVFAAKQGTIIPAGGLGKFKTAITLPICGLLFARIPVAEVALPSFLIPLDFVRRWVFSWPDWVFSGLILLMVLVTVWSLLDYLKGFIWQQYLNAAGGDKSKALRHLRLLIPNTITVLNLLCGIFATGFAWFGLFHPAVLLVLVGTMLDALDGRLARRFNAFSNFGAKLDSKADFVNFGVAPAVVIFSRLSPTWLAFLCAILYYASVHYRLRRFDQSGHGHYFEGVPSPVGAGLIVLAAISTFLSSTYIFVGIIFLISLLMVSRFPYPHLEIANRETFLKYLRIPILLFLVLTILHLLRINIANEVYAYEVLFSLVGVYIFFPLFHSPSSKE